MGETSQAIPAEAVHVRTWRPEDQHVVRDLYEHGRLAGQELPNDTAADIDNIREAYLDPPRAHFWVAELDGRVVGMVGVAEEEVNLAEIRRLRVAPELQGRGIGLRLIEAALQFCHHHGYLKVVLDTSFNQSAMTPAMEIFDRFAFQHTRTRTVGGKELVEFYLDLYREPKGEEE